MSGHSKWSTIKRKKSLMDKRRGQLFTKLAKMITVAAKEGGGNPKTNFKLKLAIDNAQRFNLPQDNIIRAIKRGTGELVDGSKMKKEIFEAWGPGGIALMIETITDNRNRTLAELKHILAEYEGRLGNVKWMFETQGVIRLPLLKLAEKEKVELAAIDAGARDIKEENKSLVVYTDPAQFSAVKKAVESLQVKIESAELELIAKNPIKIKDKAQMEKIDKLMEVLDAHNDVNEIYSNVEN